MKVFLTYGPDNETEGPITDVETMNRRMSELAKEYGSVRLERADVICDFCSWPRVAWTFAIPTAGQEMYSFMDMKEKTVEHHMDSDGLWAACDYCKAFIMTHDWESLRERAVSHADSLDTPMRGMPEALVRVGVGQAHSYFKDGWTGSDPIPLEDDDHFLSSLGIEAFDFRPYQKGFQND